MLISPEASVAIDAGPVVGSADPFGGGTPRRPRLCSMAAVAGSLRGVLGGLILARHQRVPVHEHPVRVVFFYAQTWSS